MLLVLHLYAQYVQAVLQGSTTRACRQYDSVIVYAHLLRVHNLVSRGVLQHTVLMYA